MNSLATLQAYGENLQVIETAYVSGGLALELLSQDGRPVGRLSVNLPDSAPLGPDEVYVKTWGENTALREPALATGRFVDTGKRADSGFVTAEVWRIVR